LSPLGGHRLQRQHTGNIRSIRPLCVSASPDGVERKPAKVNVTPVKLARSLTSIGGMVYLHTKREVILMQAYCVKCRAKKEMKNAKAITMKNGKPATQGVCPTCGTKMFRIGKS
jgi:hypothetical protein